METHSFHEGTLPSGFSLDFEPAVFNTAGFLALQSATAPVKFHALHLKRRKSVACVHFFLQNESARTPARAPFGSFEFSAGISPRLLFDFVAYVDRQLTDRGVKEIFIKNPPRDYFPANISLLETILVNHGYAVADAEVSAIIPVSQKPFTDIIRHSEGLRLRQAVGAQLQVRKLPSGEEMDLFHLIEIWHAAKGYPLSITKEQFQHAVRQFPDDYLLLAVMEGEKKIAGSVSVRVQQRILYNFLVNHDKAYDPLSPGLLLMQGAYDHCAENGIDLLDLGTSALDGRPNFSLLDFKLRIGGVTTSKFSFHKRTG